MEDLPLSDHRLLPPFGSRLALVAIYVIDIIYNPKRQTQDRKGKNQMQGGAEAEKSEAGASRREMIACLAATAVIPALPTPATARDGGRDLRVESPDGKLAVTLHLARDAGSPQWSAQYEGRTVLEPSALGLVLADGRLLGSRVKLESHHVKPVSEAWRPPYGMAAIHDASRNELEAVFEDTRLHIRFAIRIAAHNDGVACRYVLLKAKRNTVKLSGEQTHFRFAPGTRVWSSRDEGEYVVSTPEAIAPVPVPELTRSTDAGALADTPLLAVTPDKLFLSLCETDRLHYPRLMFAPGPDANSVVTHLMRFPGRATGYSGPGDTHPAPVFEVETPFATPWRLIMVAKEPARLLETASLPAVLATPNRIGDTGWIRPGRAFRIRKPYTTRRAMDCIAFAARRKLDYVEFDAHWYGDGTDPSDATIPIPEIDMPRIIAAAKAQGMGVILYVDRVPAMRQLPQIVRTYREWGIAGIKFGFVWEGRQEDTDFIHDVVKLCGENRLLVNLHDNLRPAGLERTLPNYVALEGVRGNEQFPTARHNVTLPFTRCAAGPIDYTICYDHYRNRTTNAHQLAMAAVYYSPLAFLYWYDEPYKYLTGHWPELRWFDECPTSWDETRGLAGAVGEYVAVARRKGKRWFIGAMTNEEGRTLSIPLDFLGDGRWTGTIYADGEAAVEARRTPVTITTKSVSAGDTLTMRLAPSGGQAISFERSE